MKNIKSFNLFESIVPNVDFLQEIKDIFEELLDDNIDYILSVNNMSLDQKFSHTSFKLQRFSGLYFQKNTVTDPILRLISFLELNNYSYKIGIEIGRAGSINGAGIDDILNNDGSIRFIYIKFKNLVR